MKQRHRQLLFLFAASFLVVGTICGQSNQPTATGLPAALATPVNRPNPYTSGSVDYIKSWTPQKPIASTATVSSDGDPVEVALTIQYVDGLGRTVQTVGRQASPGRTDIVAPVTYDALGREGYRYLPYASALADGGVKPDAFGEQSNFYSGTYASQQPAIQGEKFFYGHTVFEASPLNRPSKTFAPGNSWAGSEGSTGGEHATGMQYLVNNENDNVRIWTIGYNSPAYNNQDITTNVPVTNGIYNVGTLTKTIATDEHNHAVVEYKDIEGHIVLKKVQVANSVPDFNGQDAAWLCTYYVYDGLGQLRSVVQPKAVLSMAVPSPGNWSLDAATVAELCFRYEYDARHRMVAKKVPGAAWTYMVYDQRDRPVFTQDGNMRQRNQWLYTRYDALNRPVQTGMMQNGISRSALQAYVDGNTGSGTATTVTSGSGSGSLPADLIIPVPREYNRGSYQATNSIVFGDGFTSEDGAVFTAEITQGTGTGNPSTSITVVDDPVPSGYTTVPLTYAFYDNYAQTSKGYNTANNSKLGSGANTSAYAEGLPNSASGMVKGMPTVGRVRVLENPTDITIGGWLETATFYDDKGRAVQAQADNYKGGLETVTSRYDFLNKVLCSYSVHNNPAASVANQTVKTDISYDHAGRQLLVQVTVNDDATTKRTIEQDGYDAMGQLMGRKLGQKRDATGSLSTDPLEDASLAYNIRGWLKGMDYSYSQGVSPTPNASIAANKWFAMDLGYDWGYGTNQYNGNIAGQRWQAMGDGAERSYGYGYDPTNRLLFADFKQNFGGSGTGAAWSNNDPSNSSFNIDFSTRMGNTGTNDGTAYDANGNILAMYQKGLKLATSAPVDNLTYHYNASSNKLGSVDDGTGTTNTKLGDFTDGNTVGDDYGYDLNGNMVTDKNKGINGSTGIDQTSGGAISYNHLNLPAVITVAAKGTITYIYDAAGNKLEKRTVDNTAAGKTTVTDYISGHVYENNTLQFFGQPQGRIRPVAMPAVADGAFAYDYFIKDHLGNTRTVLTDEWKQDNYPAATLEDGATAKEGDYYSINPNDIINNPQTLSASYQNNNTILNPNPQSVTGNTSQKMYRLNGQNGDKTGLGITLRVMAGDQVDIFGKSFWHGNGSSPSNNYGIPVTALLTALAGTGAVASSGEYATASALTSNGVSPNELGNLLSNQPSTGNKPKAYINWILFDNQFRPVSSSSGFDMVGDADQLKSHMQTANIGKNGYLYVYCSNESDQDVFFDNLQLVHTRGPLLEETQYYPFGLAMAGISSKASGSLENKYKYNKGSELQHNEFSDGSGLEMYDAHFRGYDPQLGRFDQIDPLASISENQSPYNFANNNPVRLNDPLGLKAGDSVSNPIDGPSIGNTATVTAKKMPKKDNTLGYYQAAKMADDAMAKGWKIEDINLKRFGYDDRQRLYYMFSDERKKHDVIYNDRSLENVYYSILAAPVLFEFFAAEGPEMLGAIKNGVELAKDGIVKGVEFAKDGAGELTEVYEDLSVKAFGRIPNIAKDFVSKALNSPPQAIGQLGILKEVIKQVIKYSQK